MNNEFKQFRMVVSIEPFCLISTTFLLLMDASLQAEYLHLNSS